VTTAVTAGTPEHLGLYLTGLPVGSSASFTVRTVRVGAASQLKIITAVPGRYLIAVTASGSTGTHTADVTLTVTG
jgi:hypothetical protein